MGVEVGDVGVLCGRAGRVEWELWCECGYGY